MTNNLLLNSQNKSDPDETFTETSDGYCFIPNVPNQIKPAKSDLDEIFKEASDECCIKQNQTKQDQINLKISKSCQSHIDLLHKNDKA